MNFICCYPVGACLVGALSARAAFAGAAFGAPLDGAPLGAALDGAALGAALDGAALGAAFAGAALSSVELLAGAFTGALAASAFAAALLGGCAAAARAFLVQPSAPKLRVQQLAWWMKNLAPASLAWAHASRDLSCGRRGGMGGCVQARHASVLGQGVRL